MLLQRCVIMRCQLRCTHNWQRWGNRRLAAWSGFRRKCARALALLEQALDRTQADTKHVYDLLPWHPAINRRKHTGRTSREYAFMPAVSHRITFFAHCCSMRA